ncbi:MAG: hypothetical protein J0G32_05690 [Alphaproteobacteria bacterium]|mgnify:CR=1 FL=1|nr:hypothetical protein [Alphaproteobacteria bacterium]OJV15157.1 MAG: hypothetical protein BGO27_03725 [Alphaproteobacteria bacterium 33-17]
MNKFGLVLTLTFLCNTVAYAKEKLPLPRFASIKSHEVNVRTGPSVRYPIKWIFTARNEPVEILAEFEQWRKIKDFVGDEGWIHESMLSGKRFGIIAAKEKQILYKNQADTTHPLVVVEPGVKARIQECSLDWCRVIVKDYKGWIRKEKLYGVYKNEIYK